MNFKRLPTLILLSLILASCNSNDTSEFIESSESIESFESEEISETESEEKVDVLALIETKVAFKSYFESWIEENALSSYKYTLDDGKSYKKGDSEGQVTINANEVISEISFVGEDPANSYEETTYIGLFENDNLFYNIKNNSKNPSAKRYLIAEENNGVFRNVINSEDANRQLRNNTRNLGASNIANTLGWSTYINGTVGVNDINWSYDVDEVEELYYVYGDSIATLNTSVTVNSFQTTLNNKGQIISGQLESTSYNNDDFDFELNIPNDGATEISHKHSYVSEIIYEEKEVQTSPTYEQIETLFIQEITSFEYTPVAFDSTIGEDVYGEPNTVFSLSVVDAREAKIKYLPTTAIDKNSITITNSSNQKAIYFDETYNWVATEFVGEVTTLTLGNESNPNMFEIEVVVVQNPTIKPLPILGDNPTLEVVSGEGSIDTSGELPTINVSLSTSTRVLVAISTTNEGPFDYENLVVNQSEQLLLLTYPDNVSEYVEELGPNNMFIEISYWKVANVTLSILNSDGDISFSFAISISE